MEVETIAGTYRLKTESMRKQLVMDITLKLLKLDFDQIGLLQENLDRNFDAVRSISASLTGIGFSQDNVILEFEDLTRTVHIVSLSELTLEDKIYLLEEIEKL